MYLLYAKSIYLHISNIQPMYISRNMRRFDVLLSYTCTMYVIKNLPNKRYIKLETSTVHFVENCEKKCIFFKISVINDTTNNFFFLKLIKLCRASNSLRSLNLWTFKTTLKFKCENFQLKILILFIWITKVPKKTLFYIYSITLEFS